MQPFSYIPVKSQSVSTDQYGTTDPAVTTEAEETTTEGSGTAQLTTSVLLLLVVVGFCVGFANL